MKETNHHAIMHGMENALGTPLLATKIYIPAIRPELVSRPRLIKQLNAGLHRKLTLISAPAGFGKTALISEWVDDLAKGNVKENRAAHQIAWLSLDDNDNDLVRFLTYVITALNQTKAIDLLVEESIGTLQSPRPGIIEALLTTLINEIAAIPDKIVFVIDDYHLIETQSIHTVLNFLLENLPPQLHLVIATREDPPLLLSRYRARGQLTELRVADLRFSLDEAAEFLNLVMGLKLSVEEIKILENRTEGWIAGLQLAALSMRGREDISKFIENFAGENRYIVDYLVDEVLQRQPESVRHFLLQTSILDRLNGSLCDTVTTQKESTVLLDALVRENLFVIPLDDKYHWFRYHHLFADVLHAYLLKEHPDQVPILHKRASKWYEQNGSLPDAIRHALAADDFGQAAALIERAWPEMDGRFQSATWLGWAKMLPDKMVRVRPVLSVGYAWALLNGGEMEAGEVRLQEAERWLDLNLQEGEQPQEMVVVDEEQFRSLPASIATARAYIAQALGDVAGTVMYTSQALELLPKQDYTRRGPASAIQGLAYWGLGELDAAHRSLADAMAGFRMAGNITFAISGTYGLADIRIAQGRLRAAMKTYEQALHFLKEQGNPAIRGEAELYLGLSKLHREMGNTEEAAKNLLRCEQLGEQAGLDDFPHRWRVYQAQIKVDQGDLSGALDLLDEAQSLYFRTPVPNVRPIAAWKTQVWVRQGRLREAFTWVREQGLSVDEDLSYLREFEHLTLARVLIAQYRRDGIDHSIGGALQLLNRLLKAAEDGGRAGSAIEILILQALAHEAQGDIPSALMPLKQALALAAPQKYVRIFVAEGTPMAHLLYEALAENIEATYTRSLLAAFPDKEPHKIDAQKGQAELIEPLSERELEVLQLIAEGLTNQEIADRLYLSLHTIKIHARNVYAKLGVKNRTQATAKGKALGLLLT